MTVGVSFGKTREIAFQENNSRRTVAFPCPNGSAYAFCRDINVNWKHGILPIHPDNFSQEGRISIIAWGWKHQSTPFSLFESKGATPQNDP